MKVIFFTIFCLFLSATAKAELITGAFEKDGTCGGLAGAKYQSADGLAIVGEYENGTSIRLCAYVSEKTAFSNGATASALTDKGVYYVVGREAEGVFDIAEIARPGE